MELKFYVYQYIDNNGLPYYIGKGTGNRVHAKHTHTTVPVIENRKIIKDGLTEVEALELESQLVRKFGRKIDGGLLDNIKLNQWACKSGWFHSDETKEKISNGNTGKIRSIEHKVNYSSAKQKMSDSTKQKIREANIGRADDGRYAKASKTLKGKPWSIARRNAFLLSKSEKRA